MNRRGRIAEEPPGARWNVIGRWQRTLQGIPEYFERVTAGHLAGTISDDEVDSITREWKSLDARVGETMRAYERERGNARRRELERALDACATFLGTRRAS